MFLHALVEAIQSRIGHSYLPSPTCASVAKQMYRPASRCIFRYSVTHCQTSVIHLNSNYCFFSDTENTEEEQEKAWRRRQKIFCYPRGGQHSSFLSPYFCADSWRVSDSYCSCHLHQPEDLTEDEDILIGEGPRLQRPLTPVEKLNIIIGYALSRPNIR